MNTSSRPADTTRTYIGYNMNIATTATASTKTWSHGQANLNHPQLPTYRPTERALSNGRSENGSGIVTGGDNIYEDLKSRSGMNNNDKGREGGAATNYAGGD